MPMSNPEFQGPLAERLQSLGIAACDEAAARIAALEAVRITVDTPNEVCDGYQTGTIAEIEGQYGPDALFWTRDWGEEVVDLQRKLHTSCERVAALEAEVERWNEIVKDELAETLRLMEALGVVADVKDGRACMDAMLDKIGRIMQENHSLRVALSEARSAAEVLAAFSMKCVAALRNAHNAIQREAWQEGPSIEEAASALQQQIDAPTAPLNRVAGAFRTVEKWRKGLGTPNAISAMKPRKPRKRK